jgi:ribosomal protein L16 Arg81 hydroxylase
MKTIFLLAIFVETFSKPLKRTGTCTIDVKPNLSSIDFLKNYYSKRPVIIPIPKIKIKTKKSWSINQLLRKYGEVSIKVGSSSVITENRGTGTTKQSLSSFIQDLQRGKNREIFAFDRNSALFKRAPELIIAAQNIPFSYLQAMNRTKKQASDWYLSFGNKYSGVHAHHHRDGWSYMFQGSKRWFFWAPWSGLPSFTHVARFPIKEWYNKLVYPKLMKNIDMPEECEAVKGDWLYIPEGWWHATMTTSDISVAIASQVKRAVTKMGKKWSSIVKKFGHKNIVELQNTLKELEIIHKNQPNNGEAWFYGGTVMATLSNILNKMDNNNNRNKQWERLMKEIKMKKEAVNISPRNCQALHNYGIALAKSRQFDLSIEMLKKATSLCTWDQQFKKSYKSIQTLKQQQKRQLSKDEI